MANPIAAAFDRARTPSQAQQVVIETASANTGVNGGGTCKLQTPYHPGLLECLRSIPTARWNPNVEPKHWWFVWSNDPTTEAQQIACLLRLTETARNARFTVQLDGTTSAILAEGAADHGVVAVQRTNMHMQYTQLGEAKLDPYQIEDISQIMANGGRGLLAWDRGLGKTYGAIFFVENVAPSERAIGVVPEHMMLKFRRDWQKVNPQRPVYCYGIDKTGPKDWVASTNGVLIVGWASAYKLTDKVGKEFPFAALFADECHRAKNQKARRTKALRWLSLRCPYFMPMSGTPLIGRPASLWPVLNMIDPAKWGNFIKYARTYCDMKYNGFGYDFSGASNLSRLAQEIAPYVMRRLKGDVLKDLPAKSYETMIVEMEPAFKEEYDDVENDVVDAWTSMASGNPMNTMTILPKMNALMQITAKAKVAALHAWIEDYLESTNEPLVVFCKHKWLADELALKSGDPDDDDPVDPQEIRQHGEMMRIGVIHGDISHAKRDVIQQKFQAGKLRVLYVTIDAGGESYEFTAASNMLVTELDWSPHKIDQMEDRIHRRGQVNACHYTYVVCGSTIEERLAQRLQEKNSVSLAVLDPNAEIGNMVSIIADEIAHAKRTVAANQGIAP